MPLIEAIVAVFILYLSAVILNNLLREEFRISKKIHRFSSGISSLIIFGIILSIRLLFEAFGNYNIDAFLFAIMTTIFLPLHTIFLKRF